MSLSVGLRKIVKRAILLVPRPELARTVAFISHPDVADNAFAMFQYLYHRLDPAWRFFWIVKDIGLSREVIGRELPGLDFSRIEFLRADRVGTWVRSRACAYHFDTHGNSYERHSGSRCIFVSLWHGSPIKAIGRLNEHEQGYDHGPGPDYFCTASRFFDRFFIDGLGVVPDRIILTGYPRNDWLTGTLPSLPLEELDGRRYVVWMPTFSSGKEVLYSGEDKGRYTDMPISSFGCVDLNDFADIDAGLRELDIVLALKLHHHDARNELEFGRFTNIRVIKAGAEQAFGSRLYGLLARSAALISDCSSVIFDYQLTGKPIAIDSCSLAAFAQRLNFPFNPVDDGFATIANKAELIAFVGHAVGAGSRQNQSRKYNEAACANHCAAVAAAVGIA